MAKKTETTLDELNRLERHFRGLSEQASEPRVKRYYVGMADGLKKAQDVVMDEVPYTYIRDN